MGKQRVKLSDQIRQAVDASGMSRYAICKASGIDQGGMSNFMAGKRGLSLAALDALADVLGLSITTRDAAAEAKAPHAPQTHSSGRNKGKRGRA